jgi:hypothetical protein
MEREFLLGQSVSHLLYEYEIFEFFGVYYQNKIV